MIEEPCNCPVCKGERRQNHRSCRTTSGPEVKALEPSYLERRHRKD